MDDWKGKKVRITVYKKLSDRSWSSAEPSKDHTLNTDTMAYVFNEYHFIWELIFLLICRASNLLRQTVETVDGMVGPFQRDGNGIRYHVRSLNGSLRRYRKSFPLRAPSGPLLVMTRGRVSTKAASQSILNIDAYLELGDSMAMDSSLAKAQF
ncbi:hypothetical protein [Rhizobium leguminosarum]|uniref:hypothetical protein n=1 Tax=Rhizobium leguminosarum TaxID=384 RepID=UPI003F9A3E30